MMRALTTGVLVLASAAVCQADAPAGGSTRRSAPPAIAELITDLGSGDFAVRERAEQELIALGADAFDDLKLAESHQDLEIASRARYILEQLRVEWTRPDDPEAVRTLLARYGDLADSEKADHIEQLARLKTGDGLPALCRIARFDPSPQVARRAALAVLEASPKRVSERTAACRKELGGSERTPVEWISLALASANPPNPRDIAAQQAKSVEAEAALVDKDSAETTPFLLFSLLEHHLEWCRDAKLVDETADALERAIRLAADQADAVESANGLAWGLRWIIEHKQWDVLKPFHKRHEAEIAKDRKLLYYLATAFGQSGADDEAQRLSLRAYQLANNDGDQRVEIAGALAALGQVDWAKQEYRGVVEREPVVSARSLEARQELAIWLADGEDYQGAADLLGELAEALAAETGGKERFIRKLEAEREGGRESLSAALARQEYYEGLALEQNKKYDASREHLSVAAEMYERDPDILIAMYRSPGVDEEYRRDVIARIRRVSKFQQELIDEYPQVASFYNQWAWMIANTEGDYQRAVEYSKKSLELQPGEASFLDTLGRCHYAAGDLEAAVKAQRRAVKLAPHYEVMQRQLAQFEREWTERQKQKGDEPVTGDE